MKSVYFWKDGKVHIHPPMALMGMLMEGFKDCYCFDPGDIDQYRYGIPRDGERWTCVSLSDFPPEFRTHLLLLGVS